MLWAGDSKIERESGAAVADIAKICWQDRAEGDELTDERAAVSFAVSPEGGDVFF